MSYILNILVWAAMGGVLADAGILFPSWHFCIVLGLLGIGQATAIANWNKK
jgi:hypothetical protein